MQVPVRTGAERIFSLRALKRPIGVSAIVRSVEWQQGVVPFSAKSGSSNGKPVHPFIVIVMPVADSHSSNSERMAKPIFAAIRFRSPREW